jgi:hypothetical protein
MRTFQLPLNYDDQIPFDRHMQMVIKKIPLTLIKGSTSMELIDYMNVFQLGSVGACTT